MAALCGAGQQEPGLSVAVGTWLTGQCTGGHTSPRRAGRSSLAGPLARHEAAVGGGCPHQHVHTARPWPVGQRQCLVNAQQSPPPAGSQQEGTAPSPVPASARARPVPRSPHDGAVHCPWKMPEQSNC